MTDQEKQLIGDVFGIKPVAESSLVVTKATVDGVSAFLSRICLPAAEEFGFLIQDHIRNWRTRNAASVVTMAEEKLRQVPGSEHSGCSPRIALEVVEKGSWAEDAALQEMWAGLLASGCTEGADDDSNLIFINRLSAMTRIQVAIMKYACQNCRKITGLGGLAAPSERLFASIKTLVEITSEEDIQRLDREIDDMREAGLLHSEAGIDFVDSSEQAIAIADVLANITPNSLALHMFVRCEGSRNTPAQFFGLE